MVTKTHTRSIKDDTTSTYKSLTDAVLDTELRISTVVTTTSYRSEAECLGLSIDYPDGGGGDYIVVPSGTGVADGGSFIDAGSKQIKLIVNNNELALASFGLIKTLEVDQAARMQAVLAYAKSSGIGRILVDGGYYFTNTLTETDITVSFIGSSNMEDYFVFEGCDGFNIDNNTGSIRAPFVFHNVGVYSKDVNLYTGIYFKGNLNNPYNQQFQFNLSKTAGLEAGAWKTGIELDSASQSTLTMSTLQGDSVNSLTDTCLKCVDSNNVIVDSCDFTYFDEAIVVEGSGGFVISHNHIIGGITGIIKQGNENYIAVHDNHFAVSKSAVIIPDEVSNSSNHNHISDNFVLMYDDIATVTEDFIAFDISSNYNKIHDNEILRTVGSRNRYGVVLRGLGSRQASDNQILENNFNAMTKGVVIEAGVINTDVLDNHRVGVSRANLLEDNGTNTAFRGIDSTSAFTTAATHEFLTPDGTAMEIEKVATGVASGAWLSMVSHQAGGVPRVEAKGVDTDINLELKPKGAGLVQFGTTVAVGAETITHYITIRDASGTATKLAVLS